MSQTPPHEPRWLDVATVTQLNTDLVIAHGGAGAQVRDANLLGSALARPRHAWAYGQAKTIPGLAACYAVGIARNHAFVDGNKRTALMAAYVFLADNGLHLTLPQPQAVLAIEQAATGELTESDLAALLDRYSQPI